MAKKEINESEGQTKGVIEGTQEGTSQPVKRDVGEQSEAPAEVSSAVRKVKIHTTVSVDALIAGVRYVFAENKDAQVPVDVAAILVNAQKAYRQ